MKASVSVLLLTHNHQATVQEALLSVLSQTHPVAQLVISDNASSDATWQVIEKTLRTHKKKAVKKITRLRNKTAVSRFDQLHQALEVATGDLIVIQDAATKSLPERIAEIVRLYQELDRPDLWLCHSDLIAHDGRICLSPVANKLLTTSQVLDRESLHFAVTHAFTARLYGKFGPVVREIAEDLAFGFRALVGGTYVHLSNPLVRELVAGSISAETEQDKRLEALLQYAADAVCVGRTDMLEKILRVLQAEGQTLKLEAARPAAAVPPAEESADSEALGARLEALESRLTAVEEAVDLLTKIIVGAQSNSQDKPPTVRQPASIAVILHLEQLEFWPEFEQTLGHIPEPFDLFVSVREQDQAQLTSTIRQTFPEAQVRSFPRRGRDMWPFLAIFSEQRHRYRLFLKLHSASLAHLSDAEAQSRGELIQGLLGSPERVKQVLELFAQNDKVGVFVPEGYLSVASRLDPAWFGVIETLARLGAELEEDTSWAYPQGGMFWARPEALEHLVGLGFTEEDFEEDVGQADGTLAHILERLVGGALMASGLKLVSSCGPEDEFVFQHWLAGKRPSDGALAQRLRLLRAQSDFPSFQILVPLREGEEGNLAATLDSLAAQTWPNWRLTIISTLPCPDYFERELACLPHLSWHQIVSESEAEAVLRLGRESGADWLTCLFPGDRLEPHALLALAEAIHQTPKTKLWYSDESLLAKNGVPHAPNFKPDFNLDLLRAHNYLGAVWAASETIPESLPVGSPDALGYALAWRVFERHGGEGIGHIPEILCHRPPRSANPETERQIVQAHLQRLGIAAQVESGPSPAIRRILYPLSATPKVSILIPYQGRVDALISCLESLWQTDYPNFEVLVLLDPKDQEVQPYLNEQCLNQRNLRSMMITGSLSKKLNAAAEEAAGKFLLLLDQNVRAANPAWLKEMVRQGLRSEVGAVGARLTDPQGRLCGTGTILGMGEMGVAGGWFHESTVADLPNVMHVARDMSTVTLACSLIRKSLYQQIAGLNDTFQNYVHVDFCLRLREQGYLILWTPDATLIQDGSGPRLLEQAEAKQAIQEVRSLWERWGKMLGQDPAYNPNLTLIKSTPQIETTTSSPWTRYTPIKPKIVALPLDDFGIGEYRMRAPLRQLHQAGQALCHLLPAHANQSAPPVMSVAEVWRSRADVIFGHELLNDTLINVWKTYRHYCKETFLIYSQDDLAFQLPAYHPARKYFKNARRQLRQILSLSDRVIVGTEPMAEALKVWHKDIRIVPNRLEWARWGHIEPQRGEHRKPRVGWAGAAQHLGDLIWFEPVLKATWQAVDWVFFGMCPKPFRPYVAEFHNPVSFAAYPHKLATLDLDLAIAPLVVNAFNEAKSNLRLLEYGFMGWPVLATDIYPYRWNSPPIWHVPNRPELWVNMIMDLVQDREHLAEAGQKLRRWVLEHFILEQHLDEWLEALTPF